MTARDWSQFGAFVRKTREQLATAKGGREAFSLRRVAGLIGVQPSYLSKIERGMEGPPGEEKIVALANLLQVDADMLLALAGKVSSDLQAIIFKRPELFADLIRQLNDAPDHAVLRVVREVRDGDW